MVHADLDELLGSLLPFAEQQLKQRGEFIPFGGHVNAQGELTMVMGNPDDTEQPESQRVIDFLLAAGRTEAQAGKIRALAICFDVRVSLGDPTETTDAICMQLEHANGEALRA